MGKHDDNYTFELRPLGTRRPYNDFVIMKKGGEAHQSYINVLEDHLEERFKVHRESKNLVRSCQGRLCGPLLCGGGKSVGTAPCREVAHRI